MTQMKVVATLLAACAVSVSGASWGQSPPCSKDAKQYCIATIIVPAGCGSGIKVAPDPLNVKGMVEITWNVVTPGWKFTGNGIEFKFPKEQKALTFKGKTGDTTVKYDNKGDAGIYKYDISLVGPDKIDCRVDPTVINW